MTNPLVRVADLPAAASFARSRGLVAIIDNTFATPLGFQPLRRGFDIVVHSATKYLNGHSDLIAGALMGPLERVRSAKRTLDHLGGSLDPHACFLLQRGLKTLAVRFRQQCATSLALAQFLEKHPAVARVNHPGLLSHPQHARARELFAFFGAMLSFELRGGAAAAGQMFARLTLPLHAPSLGGPETLVTRPAASSHVGLSPEERARMGISDGLVYVAFVIRRATRTVYKPVLEDWIWHSVLPLIAYALLLLASLLLVRDPGPWLFVIGATALLLLFIGIHNAWDTVTYLAVERPREEDTPKKRS